MTTKSRAKPKTAPQRAKALSDSELFDLLCTPKEK
jgi:hypothetical protein